MLLLSDYSVFSAYFISVVLRNHKNLASDFVDYNFWLHCSSQRVILWYGPLLKVLWQLFLLCKAPSSVTSCCPEMQKHLKYLSQHQVIQKLAGNLPTSSEHRWSYCFLPRTFLSW